MTITTAYLPNYQLDKMQEYLDNGWFFSRSEIVRIAIREYIDKIIESNELKVEVKALDEQKVAVGEKIWNLIDKTTKFEQQSYL